MAVSIAPPGIIGQDVEFVLLSPVTPGFLIFYCNKHCGFCQRSTLRCAAVGREGSLTVIQRFQDSFRGNREGFDSDTDGVIDGVGDGCRRRHDGGLAGAHAAVRTAAAGR